MTDTSAVIDAAGDAIRLLVSIQLSLDGALSMLARGRTAMASEGLELAREGCAHLDTTLTRAQVAMAALARETDRG